VLARDTFAPFTPRFAGRDEPRAAWLADPQRRTAGAEAIRKMLRQERIAVEAVEGSDR